MISSPNWPAPPLPSNKPPTILFTWGNFSEPSHADQYKSWSLLGWLVLEVFMAESGLCSPLWHLVWSPPPPPPPSLPPPPQTLLRNNGRCWGGWECPNLPFNGTNQFLSLNFYLLISNFFLVFLIVAENAQTCLSINFSINFLLPVIATVCTMTAGYCPHKIDIGINVFKFNWQPACQFQTNGWVWAVGQNSPPASKLTVDQLACPSHTFARKFPKFGLLPFLAFFLISSL